MKTNTFDHGKAKAAPGNAETIMRRKWAVLGLLFVVVMIGASGCADYYGGGYYGGGPYYGDGPYYAGARTYYGRSYSGGGPYGPGYGPGYAAYPGSVTVAVGDRPYYTRGPGYYVGRTYYVWRPGHWRWVNGQRVWVRGHYVVRR
jgi:WXXGXW repeat (2 copies)